MTTSKRQAVYQHINTCAALQTVCCLGVQTQTGKFLCYVASVNIRENVCEVLGDSEIWVSLRISSTSLVNMYYITCRDM